MMDADFNSEDEEEEWFYESIKRYSVLRMFEFEKSPQCLQLSCEKSLCSASRDSSQHSDILELALPKKLTVLPEHEGLVKSCDFTMVSGGYTQHPLLQMEVLYSKKVLCISEENQRGVAVYSLGSDNSSVISQTGPRIGELVAPRMSYNTQTSLAVTSTDRHPLEITDTREFRVTQSINWNSGPDPGHLVQPKFVSPQVVALCSLNSGSTKLLDLGSKQIAGSISTDQDSAANTWTIASSFQSCRTEDTKLALASSSGTVFLYDLRQASEPVSRGSIDCSKHDTGFLLPVFVQFCPTNSCLFSVSGLDENVYVCSGASSEMRTVFVHDGHTKQQTGNKSALTVCHLWYDNIIISASQNKSVHCWQFKSHV